MSEFGITIDQQDNATIVTARLAFPSDYCYRLFCDAESIPKWLWVVGTAVVQRKDDKGRALEVDFLGALRRASLGYSLTYSYDDESRIVRWEGGAQGGLKALSGSASFTPNPDGGCTLRYTLTSELSTNLPQWADQLYQDRPAETVVIDFCEWVDSVAAAKGGR